MTMQLNDFMLRGLFAKHCVRELEARGLLRTPAVTAEEREEQDLFAPVPERIRAGSIRMQRYYRLLYVFENLVRDFIVKRFTEVDDEEWFDKRASTAMKQKVEDRKNKAAKNQWHVGRKDHPIYYLDFGDLGLLIQNHWAEFKDFLDNQTWIQGRIQDVELSRNVIAHTNELVPEEGDRIQMYLRDWLKQVG